jgi:cysteine desulfurase
VVVIVPRLAGFQTLAAKNVQKLGGDPPARYSRRMPTNPQPAGGHDNPQRGRAAPARRVYLDHAATTPPDPEVVEAMLPYLRDHWHNPSSIYVEAQRAAQAIDESRATIARAVGAAPDEIVFTSGGSESDSLALRGVLAASARRGRHLVTTTVEHHAVLDTAEQLARDGTAEVTLVDVGADGRVDPAAVEAAVRDDTVLVSVMHANNEVGALNDLAEIARRVHARNPRTVVHTDAVQSAAHLGVHVDRLGVDLMTFTAHKLYGPRGAGALYVRGGTPLAAQILGGGQERRLRAGTENTPAIVGFARAVGLAVERREADLAHERALQSRLVAELPRRVPLVAITGPRRLEERLPGNVSCVVAFVEGESILLALDLAGVAASSGSACTTGSVEPSHVLVAMGLPAELARGSLRFTLGRQNTDADVDRLLEVLPPVVARLRALSPVPTTEAPPEYRPWLDAEAVRG